MPVTDITEQVKVVAEPWKSSAYYGEAEMWTFIFWSEDHPFFPLFKRLDLSSVLELACGHGRHATRYLMQAGKVILMDVLDENIAVCRQRHGADPSVQFIRNNGFDFQPVADRSLTAAFCYDAMVHFSPDIVRSYIKDTARVLKPGGMALYHHSNYDAPDDRHYGLNPHARNLMTETMMRAYAAEAGLDVVTSNAIAWSELKDLDRLTLLRAP
jgi:ubiquinone/menaquinone biosynthesis C-methylase UbiE